MNNNIFNQCGSSIAQIGLYLSQIDETQFTNSEVHRNIVNFMSQLSLYLNNKIDNATIEPALLQQASTENNNYLSRKEVIDRYKPLITEYGLSQAIHKNELVFSKIGNKYFFKIEDIDKWIDNQKVNNTTHIATKFV